MITGRTVMMIHIETIIMEYKVTIIIVTNEWSIMNC